MRLIFLLQTAEPAFPARGTNRGAVASFPFWWKWRGHPGRAISTESWIDSCRSQRATAASPSRSCRRSQQRSSSQVVVRHRSARRRTDACPDARRRGFDAFEDAQATTYRLRSRNAANSRSVGQKRLLGGGHRFHTPPIRAIPRPIISAGVRQRRLPGLPSEPKSPVRCRSKLASVPNVRPHKKPQGGSGDCTSTAPRSQSFVRNVTVS